MFAAWIGPFSLLSRCSRLPFRAAAALVLQALAVRASSICTRLCALAVAVFAVSGASAQDAGGASPGSTAVKKYDRPYPIIEVQIGDVPIGVPKEWVDAKAAEIHNKGPQSFLALANTGERHRPYFGNVPIAVEVGGQALPALSR